MYGERGVSTNEKQCIEANGSTVGVTECSCFWITVGNEAFVHDIGTVILLLSTKASLFHIRDGGQKQTYNKIFLEETDSPWCGDVSLLLGSICTILNAT